MKTTQEIADTLELIEKELISIKYKLTKLQIRFDNHMTLEDQ